MALDPDFREDPYPILADLRRREPVHHDVQLCRYVLTRHDDVLEAPRMSLARQSNDGLE
jgi:hypothetical protein